MNQVIDGKIVEMKFDNSDFEKNVAQSMSTLDKLKQALNFDSAKSLDNVTKSARNFDMSAVGTAVDTVQAKFSALQVVGMTALSELTKSAMHFGANIISSIINPIKQGGMNRALNIENAKFQLQGLGVMWNDIEDDINYGVKDTAYGLDAAAKAASQLVASGVKLGDEMKTSLRAISGVAAMTNASYEEISPIFTTVAGQGKLMTMQLRQLESRGLNAAATLAKYLDVSEEEVRDMVTKGKIDFQTFADAMDDAFGEHAKDANKTFTGAMSNVRAALSRIGAKFATPYMENMRKIFVDLIQVINGVNKALDPIVNDVTYVMEYIQEIVSGILTDERLTEAWAYIVETVRDLTYEIYAILKPIGDAFNDIFPKGDAVQSFVNAAKNIRLFVRDLLISDESAENVKRTFRGLFAVIDIIGMAFKAAFDALSPFVDKLVELGKRVLGVTGDFGDYLVSLRDSIRENDTFGKAFGKVADFIMNASDRIKEAIDKIVEAFKNFKENHIDTADFSGLTGFIDAVKGRIASLGSIGDILGKIFDKVKAVFSNLAPAIHKAAEIIADALKTILTGVSGAFDGESGTAGAFFLNMFSLSGMTVVINEWKKWVGVMTNQAKNLGGLNPLFIKLKTGVVETFAKIQAELDAKIIQNIANAILTFAAAILILSLIDPGRLATSMMAIEALMMNIKEFMVLVSEISKGGGLGDSLKINALGTAMIKLAAGVLILAIAVKILSTIDLAGLVKGTAAVIILMNALSSQAILLSNFDTKVMKGATTMIAMAIAIRILASAVKVLGELPFTQLVKGLSATIVAMYALAGAMKLMNKVKIKTGTALALIATAVAIRLLVSAVEALGALPTEQLVKGGVAVGGLIIALGAFVRLAGSSKHMFSVAVAMIAIAESLKILSGVVTELGALADDQLLKGLLSVVVLIEALTVSLMMLSGFSKTGGMDYLAISVSLLIFAAALNSLTTVFERFEKISIGTIAKTFITLGLAIGAFAAAAALLTPLLVPMAALSLIILGLGVGVAALGLGVVALSAGLTTLAAAAQFVVASLGSIVTIILTLIPTIATALANAILVFLTVLANNGATLVNAIVKLGESILDGLIQLIPKVGELLITLVDTIVEVLITSVPRIVEGAITLLTGLIEGMTRALPDLIRAGNEFMITFINSLADGIREDTPRFIEAFDNLMDAALEAIVLWVSHFSEKGGELVQGLIDGAKQLWADVTAMGEELVNTAITAITSFIPNVVQAGKDFIQGFINGIKGLIDGAGGLVEAAKEAGKAAIQAVDDATDSNSPSREMYKRGEYFDEGFANGIRDNAHIVYYAADGLGATTVKKFQDYLSRVESYRKELESHWSYWDKKHLQTERETTLNRDARKEQLELNKAVRENAEVTEEATEATEKLTEATGKATKAQKDFKESIKETIEGQLDMFSKFEMKTEMSAQTMIDNMKSNIDGYASWSHRMAVLAQRFADAGIDKGLYKKLAELGPKGYETMNAFYQMSEEQLAEVKDLWATGLTLPEGQADIINSGFQYMGEMAAKGFSDALDDHMAAHDKAHGLGQAALDGLQEVLEVHSPSKATEKIGQYAVEGLRDGIDSVYGQGILYFAVKHVSEYILELFEENLSPDTMGEVGGNLIKNLFISFFGEDEESNPLISSFIAAFEDLEIITETITNFVQFIIDLFNLLFEMDDSESPSLLFYRYGQTFIVTLSNAITENTGYIHVAIILMAMQFRAWIDEEDLPGKAYEVGKNVALGMEAGINDYAEKAIKAARDLVETIIAIMEEIPEVNSPSKVTRRIGGYISEGLAIGMMDAAENVYDAASQVASGAMDGITDNAGRLQDLINSEIDFNPIITPMLDLSLIRSQMDELNALMSNPYYSPYGQNGGTFSANAEPSQINFTQNNYSPKALSRMEIYRQTQNQISMMKGVVANA